MYVPNLGMTGLDLAVPSSRNEVYVETAKAGDVDVKTIIDTEPIFQPYFVAYEMYSIVEGMLVAHVYC